jgi:tetratricopeptide (TPR) repeat protein
MIISHRRRFIFFHNPKTAGMSLRAILAPYHDDACPLHGILQRPPFDHRMDFAHLRLWEISLLFPAVLEAALTYRSLVFVRDPYRRFVSALDQHFKTYCPDLPLLSMQPEQQVAVVEIFLQRILRLEMIRADHRFVHFSPQVWFVLFNGTRVPGHILPMDDQGAFTQSGLASLGLPPHAVPHDNRSRLDLTHVLASAKIRALVRDFYAADFAFFAADPALAHLAEGALVSHVDGLRLHEAGGPCGTRRRLNPSGTHAGEEAESEAQILTAGLRSVRFDAPSRTASIHQTMDAAEVAAIAALIDAAAVDLAAGRARQAFDGIRTILADYADHPRALGMLGQIAVFAGHPAIGLAPLQRAVALDPRLEHRVWLALCLAKLGCPDDAVSVISAAITTMPPTPNAHFAVGMVFYALGRYEDAATCYAGCFALDATRADARHRYARSLHAAGATGSAIDAYMAAIRDCSTRADYYADLSGALSEAGRFDEACAAGQTAVKLDPGSIVAYNNLGHALLNLNRSAEAVAAYDKAIEASGSYAKAQFGQALACLKSGDYAGGWRQYEWRWRDSQQERLDLGVPAWRGEDVGGKTILLHAEQGLGDTLQFVRFAPLVAARGGRVVLEVPAPLVRLLRGVEGVAAVIASGDPVPRIDLHCPMASLPLVFDLRLDTIPASPYLPILERCRLGLTRRPGLVVGLVWAGDPRPSEPVLNRIDGRRSMSLDVLAPLFDIDGVCFVSFQFGEARRALADLKTAIDDAMDGVNDFADTAVRLAGVDLLISVDTSMVHLAGGLGIPVWMLSRFDGCWRWLEQRDDTPWYPSMRIFRQPSAGDWSSVVSDVGTALRTMVGRSEVVA